MKKRKKSKKSDSLKGAKFVMLGNCISTPVYASLSDLKKKIGKHFRIANYYNNFCTIEYFADPELRILNYIIMYNFPPADKLFKDFYKWSASLKHYAYTFYKDEYNLTKIKGN